MNKFLTASLMSILVLLSMPQLAMPQLAMAQNALGTQPQNELYYTEHPNTFDSGVLERNSLSACDSSCASGVQNLGPDGDTITTIDAPTIDVVGTQSQTLACPSGYTGTITQQRTVFANGSYSAWAQTQNNCVCTGTFEQQGVSCPAGQTGTLIQQRIFSCATSSWGPWYNESNNCAAPCVAPSSESRTVACPTGQVGTITQTRTAYCPAITGSSAWNAWTDTSNTCAPACSTNTQTSTMTCQSYNAPPANWDNAYVGNVTMTRTSSCATGSEVYPAWTYNTSVCNVKYRNPDYSIQLAASGIVYATDDIANHSELMDASVLTGLTWNASPNNIGTRSMGNGISISFVGPGLYTQGARVSYTGTNGSAVYLTGADRDNRLTPVVLPEFIAGLAVKDPRYGVYPQPTYAFGSYYDNKDRLNFIRCPVGYSFRVNDAKSSGGFFRGWPINKTTNPITLNSASPPSVGTMCVNNLAP